MTSSVIRGLCLAGAVLFSMNVGVGGGVLDWLGGDHPAKAVIAGAAAFAATMTLTILVLSFVNPTAPTRATRHADLETNQAAATNCRAPGRRWKPRRIE